MSNIDNPYLPYPVRIDQIVTETEDQKLKTFKLVFLNPEDEKKFKYMPGQFAEFSVAGKGEIPIGIASSPTEEGFLSFTVNEVGLVTTHLHMMKEGYVMGVRGPMGNWYPWEEMEGKNVIIIGGGFAEPPYQSVRLFVRGERKFEMRYPWHACISTISKSAICARFAAIPKRT